MEAILLRILSLSRWTNGYSCIRFIAKWDSLQPNQLLPGLVPYTNFPPPGLLTLTGVLPEYQYHHNWALTSIPELPMVKFTYIHGPAGYSRTALLIQQINQNTLLLNISGLSPDRSYMTERTNNTLLYMEPSILQTITQLYMDIRRLHSSTDQHDLLAILHTSVLFKNIILTDSFSCHFPDHSGNHP